MLELIDVSHHQGPIDFDQVIASGIAGVICKCIDGRAPDVDPMFVTNWAAMRERQDEIVIGSYAFARPESDGGGEADGRAEAEDYARTMIAAGVPDNFIVWADVEHGGFDDASHSVQQNCDFVSAWVETCEAELGRSPWIYTGTNTWRTHLGWTMRFKHLPLVDADYSSVPDRTPWPWTLWQYTSKGRVPGVSTNVDISRFDGTMLELRELEMPRILRPLRGPILPDLDLEGGDHYDPDVARAQGLMLALGQPRAGMVDEQGRPDGVRGPATRRAWANLSGQSSTVVDWRVLLA